MNNKRPNFFNGQFLKADDFIEAQAYQITAQREHNKTQHTWGITRGLFPAFDAGSTLLRISGGMGIDKEGRQIHVTDMGLEYDFNGSPEDSYYVTLAYHEKFDPDSETHETGISGFTRVVEEPQIKVSTRAPDDASIDLFIGIITLSTINNATTITAIDETLRRKAGAALGDAQANSLSLITEQMAPSLWPRLTGENIENRPRLVLDAPESLFTGDIEISQQLKAGGPVGIGIEPSPLAILQVGGALKITGDATLDQNLHTGGSAHIQGDLSTGANTAITGDLLIGGQTSATNIQAENITINDSAAIGNLVVHGNLDVKGSTTTLNTTEMEVSDNIIRVNKYAPQDTPKIINGGLEVFRGGTTPEAQIIWDESSQKWMAGTSNSLAEIPVGPLSVDSNGNIGVNTQTPFATLHIATGNEASLTAQSGHLIIGDVNSTNLVVDQNKIIARENHQAAPLHLNTGEASNAPVHIGKIETNTISTQNGQVRRDFLSWNTTQSGSTPIHIKTNIKRQSSIMYRILVEGYNYGVATAINSDVVGYTYAASTSIISTRSSNYAGGVSVSQYVSSDGFVVVKLSTSDTYYIGFSVSAWFTNPTGTSFDISATVHHQGGNL